MDIEKKLILDALHHKSMTVMELVFRTRLDQSEVQNAIDFLIAAGTVVRGALYDGRSKQSIPVYWIRPHGDR